MEVWEDGDNERGCDGDRTYIGLIHPEEPEAVLGDVVKVCLPTHETSVAIFASTIATAVAEALNPSRSLDIILEATVRLADLGELRGRWRAHP